MTGWISVAFKELFASSYDYLTLLAASLRPGRAEALGVVPERPRAGFGLSCAGFSLVSPFPSVMTFEELRLSVAGCFLFSKSFSSVF